MPSYLLGQSSDGRFIYFYFYPLVFAFSVAKANLRIYTHIHLHFLETILVHPTLILLYFETTLSEYSLNGKVSLVPVT